MGSQIVIYFISIVTLPLVKKKLPETPTLQMLIQLTFFVQHTLHTYIYRSVYIHNTIIYTIHTFYTAERWFIHTPSTYRVNWNTHCLLDISSYFLLRLRRWSKSYNYNIYYYQAKKKKVSLWIQIKKGRKISTSIGRILELKICGKILKSILIANVHCNDVNLRCVNVRFQSEFYARRRTFTSIVQWDW